MMKEDADKRRGRNERAAMAESSLGLKMAPGRFVHGSNVDDLRGPHPILVGGTVGIMQLEVEL
jgi:hypothetical protein